MVGAVAKAKVVVETISDYDDMDPVAKSIVRDLPNLEEVAA
jgi:hypothetical protein